MNIFDFYTNLIYKQRVGSLTDMEAFLFSFVLTFIFLGMYYLITYLTDKNHKHLKNFSKYILMAPFAAGILNILMNRFQRQMTKSRIKTYKKYGFSETEALEQTLLDTRHTFHKSLK